MDSKIKGNVSMLASKIFSGFNENALRYLLPAYMSATSGVLLRVGFGTLFFWLVGCLRRSHTAPSTLRQRLELLAIGFVCIFGYMFFLLKGLTYTTPIASSIFICLQPVVVFVICLVIRTERATLAKVLGIAVGVAGAAVCVLTQKTSDVASNPTLGNIYCAGSTLMYSLYLVLSKRYLRTLDSFTVSKWTFLGAVLSAAPVAFIIGWDAPVLSMAVTATPMLVLLFVLFFPSAISYWLVDVGLKNLSATVVSLYSGVILIVAALMSYAVGQDHFSWWQLLAMVLIVASIWLVEAQESKPAPAKNEAPVQHAGPQQQ